MFQPKYWQGKAEYFDLWMTDWKQARTITLAKLSSFHLNLSLTLILDSSLLSFIGHPKKLVLLIMEKIKFVEFPYTIQCGNRVPQESNFAQVPSVSFLIQFSDLNILTVDTQNFKCSSIVQWRDVSPKIVI